MEPRKPAIFTKTFDNTAERSWKIWVECGKRLQQQYRDRLLPPPPRPLRSHIKKVRKLGSMAQLCNELRHGNDAEEILENDYKRKMRAGVPRLAGRAGGVRSQPEQRNDWRN